MTQHDAAKQNQTENGRPQYHLCVSSIEVCNFRLLREVKVDLASETTVLVGRNNSGKTTLAEALTYFLDTQAPKFDLADFSTETYRQFYQAAQHYHGGKKADARKALPEITLTLKITYGADLFQYGPLAAAIVDLDPECTEAIVRFAYSLQGGRLDDLFEDLGVDTGAEITSGIEAFLQVLATRIPSLFGRTITAIDPQDSSNTRDLTIEAVRSLVTVNFLKAQRGLDDEKERPKDLIGKVFQTLFEAAMKASDDTKQKAIADELIDAVADIERDLGDKVSSMMTNLVPALESFGYPGLNNPQMEAVTTLDMTRLLANYTSIRYRSVAGVSLPESYSGLGSRNLILMLFTLLGYYREYATRDTTPSLHLIFVEEPEAHLHPQMQEVFIEQLAGVAELFPTLDGRDHLWAPQFVVSTHSSHIANRANFSSIRYFRVVTAGEGQEVKQAEILDLSCAPELDENFLHQYLTLTRSDLFFADKAILVEGTSERLIVPTAIKKIAPTLTNQYVTLMEVGGAYAHKFFPLLDFLGIPALIITDIDTVSKQNVETRSAATSVHEGDGTSNATIKQWFSDSHLAPPELLKAAETQAIIRQGRYLAYQVPEQGQQACGRTFEDAFILANPELFGLTLTGEMAEDENAARDLAQKQKKSTFALCFAIERTEWQTPRYIRRGLTWLRAYPATPDSDIASTEITEAVVK
ncbi:ATP-dependent nuclease [Corynebacterium sp. S7]